MVTRKKAFKSGAFTGLKLHKKEKRNIRNRAWSRIQPLCDIPVAMWHPKKLSKNKALVASKTVHALHNEIQQAVNTKEEKHAQTGKWAGGQV